MSISNWSSDVCSSDLEQPRPARPRVGNIPPHGVPGMNKTLLLLPLALALAACTQNAPAPGPADPMPPPADASVPYVADSATLAGHHWRLASATDADGASIDALFPGTDHVLTQDFADRRVSVSGG